MAHHKKRRHPGRRAHCHLCKYWKDGGFSRLNYNFEKRSDHNRRLGLEKDIKEES